MNEHIFNYIAGSFCVSSIMMWWFNTNLPIHCVQLLKYLGFKKNDIHFWYSDTPIELWTKVDYDDWKMRNVTPLLDELSSCPGCLSAHISLWLALFLTLILNESLGYFFLAFLGWPFIGNYMLAKLQRIQLHS